MDRNQAWRCNSIVDVGYVVGDDGRQHVADQLHTCVVRLDPNLGTTVTPRIESKCVAVIENRILARLANADVNYGVVGLKRWKPRVSSITCVPLGRSEEAEESGE